MTVELFRATLGEELDALRSSLGEQAFCDGKFTLAAELLDRLVTSSDFTEFLTLPAGEYLD